MGSVFKDFDPAATMRETSFTNMVASRCFVAAQMFYLISYIMRVTYERLTQDKATAFSVAVQ